MAEQQFSGEFQSPGGFVFGVQGWSWGEPRPRSITFFLDGTAMVCDQHGRPIKGTIVGSEEVYFARTPPSPDDVPSERAALATHARVIAALAADGFDWLAYDVRYRLNGTEKVYNNMPADKAKQLAEKLAKDGNTTVKMARTISCAGWPQLPYAELARLSELPPTPLDELRKIRDPLLRQDALRARREADVAVAKEVAAVEAE